MLNFQQSHSYRTMRSFITLPFCRNILNYNIGQVGYPLLPSVGVDMNTYAPKKKKNYKLKRHEVLIQFLMCTGAVDRTQSTISMQYDRFYWSTFFFFNFRFKRTCIWQKSNYAIIEDYTCVV